MTKREKEDKKLFKALYKNIKKQNFRKIHNILSKQ